MTRPKAQLHTAPIRKFSWLLTVAALALVFSALAWTKVVAAPGVPKTISYQGRLTDASGNLLGGAGTNYFFKFSIWDNPTVGMGNRLWPLGAPGVTTLNVASGVFNVNIGDTVNGYPDALTYNFNDNDTVYLQVEASSNNVTFETLSPRQAITSSGFAINAGSVLGRTPGTNANNLLTLDASGNIDIGGQIITGSSIQAGTGLMNGTAVTVNTAGGFTGNLIDLQVSGSSRLRVDQAGNTVVAGNLDASGAIQSGSSNVNVTLPTGYIDANAITLTASGTVGSTATSSGLEVVGNGLTLLKGCLDNQLLKWNDALEQWQCANDTGGIGGASTLQGSYDNGNSIVTTNGRNISITLADTAVDSNFTISIADNSISTVSITRANGTGVNDPAQLLVLSNLDLDRSIADGLKITSATGGIVDGIDVSGSNITNALNIGQNAILSNGVTISWSELNRLDGLDGPILDTNDAVNTSITGVGTLTSGTWNADMIGVAYGGTNNNAFNDGKFLTYN
ncbi:MAG: hypothetical protein ACM3NH_03600, partial [Candidatus Saccharibacteria bacterium]